MWQINLSERQIFSTNNRNVEVFQLKCIFRVTFSMLNIKHIWEIIVLHLNGPCMFQNFCNAYRKLNTYETIFIVIIRYFLTHSTHFNCRMNIYEIHIPWDYSIERSLNLSKVWNMLELRIYTLGTNTNKMWKLSSMTNGKSISFMFIQYCTTWVVCQKVSK